MENLENVLSSACDFEPEVRAQALRQLELWATEPNFHQSLQLIAFDSSKNLKIRQLAVISLKNGVSKYWRKSASGAIQDQEKVIIRNRLLENLNEPISQIANFSAVVTAKIVRFDFPNDWPDLLDRLVQIVQNSFAVDSNNYFLRYNSLYTLHLSMKALITKSLPQARKITQSVTPDVFKYISSIMHAELSQFFQTGEEQLELRVQHLSVARIALKCLRRLLIHGFKRFSESQLVLDFLEYIGDCLPRLFSFRETIIPHAPAFLNMLKILDSFLKTVGKLAVDASQDRVIDFVMSPAAIPLTKMYWSILERKFSSDDEIIITMRLQALKIVKNIASSQEFAVISLKDRDERIDNVLSVVKSNLLTVEFVISAAQLLISNYLILDEEALDNWNESPEDFFGDNEADQWEFNIRLCSEKLLMVLVSKNKGILCPLLSKSLGSLTSETSKNAILLKEAVYSAFSVCVYDLVDVFNFDDFLLHVIVPEARLSNIAGLKVIKRRLALLISHWVGVKSEKSHRIVIYEVLFALMGESDLVVRLTVVNALKVVLDDFDFEAPVFEPFLIPFTDKFMVLLNHDIDSFDAKIGIINALIVIIERMEGQIIPCIAPLLAALPELWKRSEGQNLFRASIVAIITKLVKALKAESFQLMEIVIPILQVSLETSNPGHLYLLEEGLDLWLASLQNASQCPIDYLNLLPAGIQQLEYGNESLKKVLHILECYLVLAPVATLELFAGPLISGISLLLGNLTAVASKALLRFVDIMAQSCYLAGRFTELLHFMHVNGLMNKIFVIILDGQDLNVILVGFLMLIARMLVYDAESVLKIIHEGGGAVGVGRFLGIMLEKYDALAHIRQRKLCVLGVISLLGTGDSIVVGKLLDVSIIVTSVHAELCKIDQSTSFLFTFEPRDGDDDESCLDFKRREMMQSKDLLYNNGAFLPFLKVKFGDCENKLGNPGLLAQLVVMDGEIGNQMIRLLQ